MTTTFSHDAFAPDSRPSRPSPRNGAAGSTSLLVTIATRHPPCQRFRRKSPNAGLTWFEDCRSLGAEFARPGNLSYSSGDSDAFSAYIFLVWRAARESHPTIAVALQWSVSQVRASELRCWMSAIGAPRTVALMLQLSAKRNLTLRSDIRAVRSFTRARLWLSSQRLEDAEPPRYHR